MKTQQEIRYFVYCRKSSEAEDRQVQSVEEQQRELDDFIKKNDLNVVGEPFHEAKSAHHPGRPIFDDMIQKVENKRANALLVWHANRASRNPIDSGTIIHLMDEKKMIHLRTPSHIYSNTPTDKMMLSLEFMMSKKDSDDKSAFVKNGLKTRYLKGFPNGVACIGYLNDPTGEKGNKKWMVDPQKFDQVKKLLQLYLKEAMSIPSLVKYADEVLCLRTVTRKKEGGHPITISGMHNLLRYPVYAGFFYTENENGEDIKYNLNELIPRMITEEDYWKIQEKLGLKGKPRPSTWKNDFAYKTHSSCGGCGGIIIAEHQYQLICPNRVCKKKFAYRSKMHCPGCGESIEKMENPTYLHYIRYHCNKQKTKCLEPSILEPKIDEDVASYFEGKLQISPDLRDWCLQHFNELDELDMQDEFEIRASWDRQLKEKLKELDELKLMRARRMIESDEELMRLLIPVKVEIKKAEVALISLGNKGDPKRLEEAKRYFDLAVGIADIFRKGTFQEKKEALSETGSNLTLKDKNTTISPREELKILVSGLLLAKQENPSFEPKNFTNPPTQKGDLTPFSPELKTLLPE